MPSIRIGLTTDFNLVGEQVGIGTTNPTVTLEVAGEIRTNNISAPSGVTTFTEYTGFLQPVQLISNTVSIAETTKGNLNSLSDEIKISGEVTIEPDVSVTGGRLDSLTANDRFAVPLGETNNRENTPEAGTTRFNQDFGTLEFFDGANWKTVNSYARPGGGGRSIFGGASGANNALEYITISTLGNAIDFGDTADTHPEHDRCASCSSSTRGIIAGGRIRVPATANTNAIGYFALASGGRSADFGDLTRTQRMMMGVSSSTRGVFAGGYNPTSNIIDYIEIDTTGNALDFGDLTFVNQSAGSFSNGVIGVWGGGYSPARRNEITKVTIASKGDSVDFGTITQKRAFLGGCSNSTRGIFAGGDPGPFSIIDYITITEGGNATVFGDLTIARNGQAAASSQTRGVIGGGGTPSNLKTIDYVQFSTTSNAIDFGDLGTTGGRFIIGLSDSHGGLGGF